LNFPFYIAKRYLISASSTNAINIINRITSILIIVVTTAMFVVLSVFSGLKDFSLSFSNDFDPDLKIFPAIGKTFSITETQEQQLKEISGVSNTSKIVEERVLFMFDGKEIVTYLKGVDGVFQKVNNVKKTLYQGEWLDQNTTQVVVGYGIAQKLSLGLFDYNNPFEVFVPRPGKGTIETTEEAFNKTNLAPIGVYAISEDLDSKYVFADLGLAQNLLELKPNQISAIELKLKSNADQATVISKIKTIFNNKIIVKNRSQLNDSLYKMLNTENIAILFIFTLVVIISLFTLFGALIMMILDKKQNLKTLFNLGVEIQDLRKIFLYQGTLVSFFGGIIGLLLGIIIVLIQQHFQLVMITPTLAYPVGFTFQNVFIVFATIILLGVLASWIASSSMNKRLFN
jgi:lipoprotein-releasing system permease protein